MSKYLMGAFLSAAFALNQSACMADEVNSTTVQTDTPLGSSSTTVESKSDATGQATAVKKTKTRPGASESTTYKAKAGPGGAKVSKTKKKVRQNYDGSVSADTKNETHAVNGSGSVHHQSEKSETVDTDGSTTSVKREKTESSQ